jgi:hypothetical protein
MSDAVTIKILLLKGNAKSIRTVGIDNWSGKGIAASRNEMPELLLRSEINQAGVYILIGENSENGEPIAYVGESENLRERIKTHDSKKDFWEQIIIFTSVDDTLTKAHILFLEKLIIEEAIRVGRIKLENSNDRKAKLPEIDNHAMVAFMNKLKQLLPILGSDLLTPIVPIVPRDKKAGDNILYFNNKEHIAKGNRTNNGFVVYSGSEAVVEMQLSGRKMLSLVSNRDRFKKEGVLVLKNNKLVFTKDVEFTSPSAAASIICGGSANGLTAWRDSEGKALKEIESI